MYTILQRQPLLLLFIVLANCLISYISIQNDPIINNDGVTYLASAQSILRGDFSQALQYYNWPFYSFAIAGTSFVFSLEIETAAYVLNIALATSLSFAFIAIISELSDGDMPTILIATIVILTFPSLIKYRPFIIRDFGYLSCYFWSLYFLFRFYKTPKKSIIISWSCCAILAFLFRFEGIIFFFIGAYYLISFAKKAHPHRKKILIALSYALAIFSVFLLVWYIQNKYGPSIEVAQKQGKHIYTIVDLFLANLSHSFNEQSINIYSIVYFIASKAGDVLYELIRRLSIVYLPIALFALHKGLTFNQANTKRTWWVFIIVNVFVLFGYSIFNNSLISRYTLATGLTILLLAPFALRYCFYHFKTLSIAKKLVWILALLIIAISCTKKLLKKTPNTYIKTAGLWLSQNLPKDTSLYSNNKLFMYYAGTQLDDNMANQYNINTIIHGLNTRQLYQYEYVALIADLKNKVDDVTRQTLSYHYGEPIKIFPGKGQKGVYIFKYVRPSLCIDPDRVKVMQVD